MNQEEKLFSGQIQDIPFEWQRDFDDEVFIVPSPEEDKFREQDIENRKKFQERLKDLPEETRMTIDFAYDLGKEAHRPQVRETGERYFEHLRNVALILIDECKIKDPDMICAALLHDSVEDSAMFGNATKPYSEWQKTARFRLTKAFNAEVAEMVVALTKPKIDGEEIKTKEQGHELYIKNLYAAPAKVVLMKMCDRLHNLRTLGGTKPEKQAKQIRETEEIYFPLFEGVLKEHPEQGQYLLNEMKKEIEKLR